MATTRDRKIPTIITHGGAGTLWLAGWLFTIGYAHLTGWKAFLGLFAWPYFIGTVVR